MRICAVGFLCLLPAIASTQTPVIIDRILSRPHGEVLTLSDVWQAIDLRLVQASSSDVAAVQTALENRRLLLREVERLAPGDPDAARVAGLRDMWSQRFDLAADAASALRVAGWSDADLTAWMRDDARIAAYVEQRFDTTPAADRPSAIAAWIAQLRARAGLR